MKNKMTDELSTFIDKVQRIGMELFDEYNSLIEGVEYTCELTDVIDSLYEFSLLKKKDTINQRGNDL